MIQNTLHVSNTWHPRSKHHRSKLCIDSFYFKFSSFFSHCFLLECSHRPQWKPRLLRWLRKSAPARFIWNLIGAEHWIPPTAGINWIMLLFTNKSSFLIGKSCPALYSPINGSIVSQSCGSLFGSEATLACNMGHRLSGSRVRSCQEDGAWSGRNTSCSSKIKRKRQGHPTTVFCKISIRERK